mmetsp:Transcript_48474/g.43450  ORF Transcript_48474/g.43450 Transcript_48474/m.43450 type:complete len:288 (-) Transcript_48474:47-910(-)
MNYLSLSLMVIPLSGLFINNKYIPDVIENSACQGTPAGSGFRLVRHSVLQNDGSWPRALDRLEGNALNVYIEDDNNPDPNAFPNDPSSDLSYSVQFDFLLNDDTEIMISDENCNEFVVLRNEDIRDCTFNDGVIPTNKIIAKQSLTTSTENVWMKRCDSNVQNPIISFGHEWAAWKDDSARQLYIGAGWPGIGSGSAIQRRQTMKYSNVWIKVDDLGGVCDANTDPFTISEPNGYILVSTNLFYGLIAGFIVLFMVLMVCMVRSTSSKNRKTKYSKVRMESETDIEN